VKGENANQCQKMPIFKGIYDQQSMQSAAKRAAHLIGAK
jgi:hypothetical protein